MHEIWKFLLEALCRRGQQELSACYLSLVESPLTPYGARRNLLENIFEKYGPAGVHLAHSGQMAVYGSGVQSGLVLEVLHLHLFVLD
jgi:actin-related protein